MITIAVYFEIPVTDMKRAMAFYTRVFGIEFKRVMIDGNDMALFPFSEQAEGCSGALAKGESYVPSLDGVRIYLSVADIEQTMASALHAGACSLYPVTMVMNRFKVAEFQDSEGNRIALQQRLPSSL